MNRPPTSPSANLLDAALAYAARGLPVFPVKLDKSPLTPHGFKDATTEPDTIRRWSWHLASGVGMATGAVSGVVVLDIDEGGRETLADLERELGPLPDGPITVTASGGEHRWFAYPRDGKRVPSPPRIAPGIDVRADGGYVLVPPSRARTKDGAVGAYTWRVSLDAPLPQLPPAWLAYLRGERRKEPVPVSASVNGHHPHRLTVIEEKEKEKDLADWLAGAEEGGRQTHLFGFAHWLWRNGYRQDHALELVRLAARNCRPPWGSRTDDYEKPEQLVARVYQWHADQARAAGAPGGGGGGAGGGLLELTGAELLRLADEGGAEALPSLPLLGREGYVIRGWSHLVAGYPRVGKTELLVACALAWARAGERVLYLTEEPRSIWVTRLARLARDAGTDAWLENLRVVIALGTDPELLLERVARGDETAVIVDTLRALLGVTDETDNSAVARALTPWIAACRQREATLIMSHHERKGGGQNGEGIAGGHALFALFDVALELLRDGQHPHWRLLRAFARVITPPELLYERTPDGTFQALGDPDDVQRDEVRRRVLAALTEAWQTTTEVWEALDEPRPSREAVRMALLDLVQQGSVERDPPVTAPRTQGKTFRWRLVTGTTGGVTNTDDTTTTTDDGVVALPVPLNFQLPRT